MKQESSRSPPTRMGAYQIRCLAHKNVMFFRARWPRAPLARHGSERPEFCAIKDAQAEVTMAGDQAQEIR
jgi:hypothetical protein